ncbi:hypothetical protein WR25_00027 [Diploscapter pachys]|uniref:Nematode cuticle collagen N-terminal domain-containing protein n=1 Tax=Diploscapter pachys TaxID=2018661 RepID=A0A2A2KDU4_9BILA|nr:hypothetical protein WR25_00027 [Diploscapter pachys]
MTSSCGGSSSAAACSKESDEQQQMRRVAFVAVVVSTAAVIASVVTLPMLYSYVQSFQSHLMVETDYCKARSRDMWLEMTALQAGKGIVHRQKRAWLFGQWIPEGGNGGGGSNSNYGSGAAGAQSNAAGYGGYGAVVNAEPAPVCCTCNQGAAGPPEPGLDGKSGRDAELIPAPQSEPCVICPPGPSGPMGMMGPKRTEWLVNLISHFIYSFRYKFNIIEFLRPVGRPGRDGMKGAPGAPGRLIPVPGPMGPAGKPDQMAAQDPMGHRIPAHPPETQEPQERKEDQDQEDCQAPQDQM